MEGWKDMGKGYGVEELFNDKRSKKKIRKALRGFPYNQDYASVLDSVSDASYSLSIEKPLWTSLTTAGANPRV